MLETLSITDQLTGLNNRRYFDERFEVELGIAHRYKKHLSLVLIDIDHFKSINDSCGHLVGDQILKEFSRLLRANIRATDLLARWGGEEFILLLPETTAENARVLAEKICAAVSEHSFLGMDQVTASFGVTEMNHTKDSTVEAIRRADDALYQAKEEGRNRVILASC